MKPIIDLETGLSYVFGKGCEEKDKCKRGDPPALFDLTWVFSFLSRLDIRKTVIQIIALVGPFLYYRKIS
jgi:hypothetical protein